MVRYSPIPVRAISQKPQFIVIFCNSKPLYPFPRFREVFSQMFGRWIPIGKVKEHFYRSLCRHLETNEYMLSMRHSKKKHCKTGHLCFEAWESLSQSNSHSYTVTLHKAVWSKKPF